VIVKNELSLSEGKKPYQQPSLRVYGNVHRVTQGVMNTKGNPDGNMTKTTG